MRLLHQQNMIKYALPGDVSIFPHRWRGPYIIIPSVDHCGAKTELLDQIKIEIHDDNNMLRELCCIV